MQVMKSFHDKGVKHVVLTSLSLPQYDNELVLLASEKGTLFSSVQPGYNVTFKYFSILSKMHLPHNTKSMFIAAEQIN